MEMHIPESLRLNALKQPEKTAIVFKDRKMTYRKLNQRVNRLANALSAFGFKPGDKIAILMENCPEFLESYFALTKLGIIPVAFSYRLTDSDLKKILTKSESCGIIVQEKYVHRVHSLDLPLTLFIVVDKEGSNGIYKNSQNYESLVAEASDNEPGRMHYSSTLMLHTSGTTGVPKGIVRSRWGFLYRAVEQGIQTNDRMLAIAPLCLSAGATYTLLSLFIGGTIYLMDNSDPEVALRLIEKEKLTTSLILSTLFPRFLSVSNLKSYNLSSMRVIVSGGGQITEKNKFAIVEAFGQIVAFYAGSTEVGPYSNLRPEDMLRKKGNCIGQPFYGVELTLLDDKGNEVLKGEIGEICVRNSFGFDEYYKDPEATQEIRRGSYLSVGDLGKRDEEGYLYFVGRKRDIIKSGGINIYAPEIEEVLLKHPSIKEAAVIGVLHPEWIEAVKALVVLREGAMVTKEEIIAYCQENLASYKKPQSIEFITELPRNLTGRVLKEELRKKFSGES